MCESEVEAAMPKIIDSIAAPILFQNSQKLCDIFIFGMAYQEVFDRVHI